jgi:non-specific serine/threonine protein kinase
LDGAAKAAYRQRLAELRAELEEAERFHDAGRAASVHQEIEALTEQLAAAVGLGGRDRLAASDTERARSAVTHGIRAALRKIRPQMPLLADGLARSIRTGTYCAYSPDPAHLIDWAL